ncbi:MAG: hypothetical protein ACFFDN_45940 [Candidatus Hodarchaeota archaeon]
MIDKEKILAKVLQSSQFKESTRYQELLEYLVKASENKEYVKETTIAVDLFRKDLGFDPHSDPTIRVYISNLRKKLDHYYLTEGKEDRIRIEVPKGHYYVEFVPVDNDRKKPINYKHLTYFLFLPLVIILISIIIIQKKHIRPKNKEQAFTAEHPVWGEFFQINNNPTLVVLGDYFFLFEKKEGGSGGYFVRDPRINSSDELRQLLKKDPRVIERFVECNFTYLGPSSAESMTYILPVLLQSPNKIYLKLSSELKWEELNRYNVIFVGSFKTLYELKKLFANFPFRYRVIPPQLYLLDGKSDTIKTFKAMQTERASYKKDYGVIVKHLGTENNIIMLLTGFDELGVIESVKRITDPNFISQLKNSHQIEHIQKPFFFFFFIEAEGVDRFSINSKIEYFQILK